MQINLEPDFVVNETMPVLMTTIESLGLSQEQISVLMAVRKKGKNLTHAVEHRARVSAMMEKLKVTLDRATVLKLIVSMKEDINKQQRTLEVNLEIERKKREELNNCRKYYNEGDFKYYH